MVLVTKEIHLSKRPFIDSIKRKRKRSDSVLSQKAPTPTEMSKGHE